MGLLKGSELQKNCLCFGGIFVTYGYYANNIILVVFRPTYFDRPVSEKGEA